MEKRPRIVAYGHSWVAGEAASAPERSFVARVAAQVGGCLDNRAVGGSSSRDLARLLKRDGCPKSDVYLLMVGLNDARLYGADPKGLRTYGRCLSAALAVLEAATPRAVVFGIEQPTLLDYTGYPPHNHGSDEAVRAHNDVLRRVCRKRGGEVVRVAGWDPATMLDADSVHPNDVGHARIAAAVGSALSASAMASTRPVHD